jgi:hypothetical protein
MKTLNFKNAIVSLLDDGIIHIHLKAFTEITITDAALIVEAIEKLGEQKKMPVLIDAGEYSTVDKEVRAFSASEECNIFTKADAIAYNNGGQKIIANFYLKQNKPVVPTKIFANKKEAVVWLKTFIK